MCGIVGVLSQNGATPPCEALMRQMLAMIRHRGPDQFGIYLEDTFGMGNGRLSIVDLNSGQQPISSEDRRFWIVYNGEVYNYRVDIAKGLVDLQECAVRLLERHANGR